MTALERKCPVLCTSAALCIALICAVVTVDGRADSGGSGSGSTAAQALFDQAKQLAREGRYTEACPKFEESQRIDPGSGTLINLADCYEKLGRIASAWSTFLEAGTAADAASNSLRAETARKRAAELAPALARITIVVADPPAEPSLQISRDGVNVGQAQWGVAIPVDEGSHVFVASAAGKRTWSTTIVIQGRSSNTQVIVPVLDPLPRMLVAESREPPRPAPQTMRISDRASAERRIGIGPQRTAALVAAGIGVVGASLGTVFGLQSKSARDKANQYCNNDECWDDRGVNLKSDAMSRGNVATALFVAGTVGLASATVLWFYAEHTPPAQSSRIGVGPGSVVLRGNF